MNEPKHECRFRGARGGGSPHGKPARRGIALVVAACAALFACARDDAQRDAAAQDERVSWKMASTFAGTLPVLGTGGLEFARRVGVASRGRIEIKYFDPGKLVPPLEIFDAVSKGAVDAGWSVSGYWVGKIPAAAFFTSVPFGPGATEFLTWIYRGGGLELWRELYAPSNLFVIPCGMVPPDGSGWFREPIASLAQLQGKKIRYFGLGGETMQKLGASVQLLAGGDIYPALERGVLDALEFAQPAIDKELGFYRIVKHYYFPGWHQADSILELIVNMDRWKALDAAGQMLIEMACKDSLVNMSAYGESIQTPALEFFKNNGVTLHEWSPEELRGFHAAYEQVLAENAAKDPGFQRVYESYRTFRASYREWSRLSRVPAGAMDR